ncbi:hypothetical protein JNO54_10110 [Janibacter sp. YIM B02568]|nr:hypothetical protein [Janibacter endophyticus]MBM6546492.1 hypothetical protein [Janibacter endophyticus]
MIANIVAPAVAGALLATMSLFGLVTATIGAPDENPADQPVITYGER